MVPNVAIWAPAKWNLAGSNLETSYWRLPPPADGA